MGFYPYLIYFGIGMSSAITASFGLFNIDMFLFVISILVLTFKEIIFPSKCFICHSFVSILCQIDVFFRQPLA